MEQNLRQGIWDKRFTLGGAQEKPKKEVKDASYNRRKPGKDVVSWCVASA